MCKVSHFLRNWTAFTYLITMALYLFSRGQKIVLVAFGTWVTPAILSTHDTIYASVLKPEHSLISTNCILQPNQKIVTLLNSLAIIIAPLLVILLRFKTSHCHPLRKLGQLGSESGLGPNRKEKSIKIKILCLVFFATHSPLEALSMVQTLAPPNLIQDKKLETVLSMVFTWLSCLSGIITPLVFFIIIPSQEPTHTRAYELGLINRKHEFLSPKSSSSSRTLTSTSSNASTRSTICSSSDDQHSTLRQMLSFQDSILEEDEPEINEDPTETHQFVNFPTKASKRVILADVH